MQNRGGKLHGLGRRMGILAGAFACLLIFGATWGQIGRGRLRRGGQRQEEVQFAGSRWTYQKLPDLSSRERFSRAMKARREGRAHYERARSKARALSQKLESYVRRWLRGKADADLPEGLLPPYIDNEKTHSWKLMRPEEVTPEQQWFALPSYDPRKVLHQNSPDPHATYLKLIYIAPIGSRLLVEGDFPHARFMDYQILQPFDPLHPVTGNMGVCEVPIVDVDIDPDPGHVNPFRVGANRNAGRRHYRLAFEIRAGNSVELNGEAMKPPAYRGQENSRVGGPFGFAGPWGDNVLVPAVLWLRIYAPDKDKGPYGGVPWPKATLQLPSGEKFWLASDFSKAARDQTTTVANRPTAPMRPLRIEGPHFGWFKMFGILLMNIESNAYRRSVERSENPGAAKRRIRNVLRLMFNRGEEAPPPGNHEAGATECNYISYLLRPMGLGRNSVIVVTGKLPNFPPTRDGEPTMTSGDVRYLSITHQQGKGGLGQGIHTGIPQGSLMDDEIVVDGQNRYVIAYSRGEERPANARAQYGVTWQEWGSAGHQVFVLRWMSVRPDWHLPRFAPDATNIPWGKGAWSSDHYQRSLVGQNQAGVMGAYHPVVHYMSRQEFEALGTRIRADRIPEWK